MKKIRLYGCPKEMVESYQRITPITKVEVSSINDDDLSMTLEESFKIDNDYHENSIYEEMFMIMQGFDTVAMMAFLNKLKELDIPFGGIKIMQTDHNKDWKLMELFKEVKQEHELFQKSEVLKQVLMSTNNIKLHSLSEKKQVIFKETLMKGYMILQSPDRTLEVVEGSIKEILSLLKEIQ
ncbi:DUF3783 domain-containing protein [Anaerorhabdus sp.]|uniref:DUF3783 domain-containing protein n=1 Tax=Anaerorhabdus sp. TaxID=1872524 RepID=UPI002FCBEAB7